MNKPQLLQRLQDIEWDNFEVKTARKDIPKDGWETVSAFANTSGGWVVFGIFIRTGSGDQRASEFEINALYRDQSFGTMSGKIVEGTNVESLNKASYDNFHNYLQRMVPRLPYNKMDNEIYSEPRYTYRITEQENLWEYYFVLFQRLLIYANNPLTIGEMGIGHNGALPRPVEELLKADESYPRNPVLAKLFRIARLCESAGYGFDKMLEWSFA